MMPSFWQLLILIAVIVLLFGTKKLRNLGSDLGESIKGFKKAMSEEENKSADQQDADFSSSKQTDSSTVENNSTDNKKE